MKIRTPDFFTAEGRGVFHNTGQPLSGPIMRLQNDDTWFLFTGIKKRLYYEVTMKPVFMTSYMCERESVRENV